MRDLRRLRSHQADASNAAGACRLFAWIGFRNGGYWNNRRRGIIAYRPACVVALVRLPSRLFALRAIFLSDISHIGQAYPGLKQAGLRFTAGQRGKSRAEAP